MGMQFSAVGNITKVELDGRLDSANVDRMETLFAANLVPAGKSAIVDLSQVVFLASLGIRMLISTARALSRSGAKLALFGAIAPVMDVIETTALNEIVPVVRTESEAIALVST